MVRDEQAGGVQKTSHLSTYLLVLLTKSHAEFLTGTPAGLCKESSLSEISEESPPIPSQAMCIKYILLVMKSVMFQSLKSYCKFQIIALT